MDYLMGTTIGQVLVFVAVGFLLVVVGAVAWWALGTRNETYDTSFLQVGLCTCYTLD